MILASFAVITTVIAISSGLQSRFKSPDQKGKCAWIKGGSIAQHINKRRQIVEACLFDTILSKHNQAPRLLTDPPIRPGIGNKAVDVLLQDLVILNYAGQDMFRPFSSISGTASVSWVDNRFQWDQNEWLIDNMTITDSEDIWVPESTQLNFLTKAASDGGSFRFINRRSNYDFRNIKVTFKGEATAQVAFKEVADCSWDEYYYPVETSYCCTKFGFQASNAVRSYKFPDGRDKLFGRVTSSDRYARTKWSVKKAEIFRPKSDDPNSFKFCFQVSRSSAVIKMELNLPMIIVAVLLIISSFFGSMKSQIYVKMFAILIQIVCIQFLFHRSSLDYLTQKPRIFIFYELTFGITLTSFVVTLIFIALSKIQKITLVPHCYLQTLTANVDRVWCFNNVVDVSSSDHHTSSNGATGKDEKGGASKKNLAVEWRPIFVALNSLISILLVVIYAIVVIFM